MSGLAGLATCVHCGFCLQSCPTYLVTGDEADSPRGRIVLMQRLESGALTAGDPALRYHLDRCLGCRACEPVCPSGVTYGSALEAVRDALAATRSAPLVARALLFVIAHAGMRRLVFGGARWLRPVAARLAGWTRLGFAMGMLARTKPWRPERPPPHLVGNPPDRPETGRGEAVVFEGCVQRELFAHVNAGAGRTLAANGYLLTTVPAQRCCGALHAHAGDLDGARALARANVRAFSAVPTAHIAATAAGCGAMLREYGTLLADDPLADEARRFANRVRDITELLADAGPVPGAPFPLRVAYDPPCHLLHAQRVDKAPSSVLGSIPELVIVPHAEAEVCCGSAGIYSLLQPSLSQAVLQRKLDALASADPDVVVTGNPGCAMQIGAGLAASKRHIQVAHPVEILDASYAAAGRYGPAGVDSST